MHRASGPSSPRCSHATRAWCDGDDDDDDGGDDDYNGDAAGDDDGGDGVMMMTMMMSVALKNLGAIIFRADSHGKNPDA